MKCPFKFNNPCCDIDESCDPECACRLDVFGTNCDGVDVLNGHVCAFAANSDNTHKDKVKVKARVDTCK